jgi:hypothetical protein
MQCEFQAGEPGRLLCRIQDADGEHIVGAASPAEAVAGMSAALDDVETTGAADCYWTDANSEYRWVFKRHGERLRVAVLRLTGVVPGYQHVAWVEEDASLLIASLRTAIAQIPWPSAASRE